MHGSNETKRKCVLRTAPPTCRGTDIGSTFRSSSFHQARHQLGLLANPTGYGVCPANYFYYTIWLFVLQQAAINFGITSAPEHFQWRMSEILRGLEGVVCLINDIPVHGWTQEEHDERLKAVLQWLQDDFTLNTKGCEFSQS